MTSKIEQLQNRFYSFQNSLHMFELFSLELELQQDMFSSRFLGKDKILVDIRDR